MLNAYKLLHIVIAISLSVLYSCFIIQLTDPSMFCYLYLIGYYSLFLLYTLKTYAIFHFPPTQPNLHSTLLDIDLVFQYKRTQERRRQLQSLMQDNKANDQTQYLKQYIKLIVQPSFCDICERVQPPRAYHCLDCDTCIIGKQKHSKLIGFCIGFNNQKVYLIYVLITKILSLYAVISLMIAQFTNSNRFQKLQIHGQAIYFLLLIVLMMCFYSFLKEFTIFLTHIQQNKTLYESTNHYLQNNNPFSQVKVSLTYTDCLKDLVNLQLIGDSQKWMTDLQQEQIEE